MKTTTLITTAATSVAGLALGVASYQAIAPTSARVEPEASTVPDVATPSHRPAVKVRFKPCGPGESLEAGACVTHLTRTVVAEPSAPAVADAGTVGDEDESSSGPGSDDSATSHQSRDDGDDQGEDADEVGDDHGDDADEAEEADDDSGHDELGDDSGSGDSGSGDSGDLAEPDDD